MIVQATYLNLNSTNVTSVCWRSIDGLIWHGIWGGVGHGQNSGEAGHQDSYKYLDENVDSINKLVDIEFDL